MNQETTTKNSDAEQYFDQKRVRSAFDRAAEKYQQVAVLQTEVCNRLLEKLEIVKIKPQMILDAGTGTGAAIPALFARYKKAQIVTLDLSENMLLKANQHGNFLRAPQAVCGDIEKLPFTDDSFDLIFSSLSMQWCNDLNAAFVEAKRVLKPGGLYVFTTFGPDTLKELRHSWSTADKKNHVNQFVDMHDIGDALLQDGFAEPVMEAEMLTVTYNTVDALMHDLKAIGANVTSSESKINSKGLGGKAMLKTVRESYEKYRQNDLLPATYEIIYGHAWKTNTDSTKDNTNKQRLVDFGL
ncbi:Malonyl-[acyl-carrier protein] O-methyltransferase [hydrothermal vent metagenome]|uniref:malonyl-[acyl-carrier protein] O-methyltransferase n=1 Tax=hydrothermal vent metagenome TaxID=652676 RepID=A0A3B0W837_9ZZZZ